MQFYFSIDLFCVYMCDFGVWYKALKQALTWPFLYRPDQNLLQSELKSMKLWVYSSLYVDISA